MTIHALNLVLEHLAPLVDQAKIPGIAVGLLDHDRHWVFGLGRVAEPGSSVPDGRTLFEIGSISKVYTGVLLAEMVDRGEVELDEPVADLLPDGISVPARSDKPITLRQLASHRSGLPRIPGNLPVWNFRDPYDNYTIQNLYDFLGRHPLRRDPGEKAEYSNLGMGLLGHALACRAGISYEDLIAERIARPLGMVDTVRTLDPARRNRLAAPFDDKGKPASNWELRSLAGAGGLRSTVNDQLHFLAAALEPDETTPLGRAFKQSRQPQGKFEGRDSQIGLAWILMPDGSILHNGRTGGYTAFLGLQPASKTALVVLTNASTDHLDPACLTLLKALATPA